MGYFFVIDSSKGMKRVLLLLPILAIIIAISLPVICEATQVISHKILNVSKSGPDEILLNVEIDLIDGRLPNKHELEDLSTYLVKKEKKQDSISIHYYLPGTDQESDIIASASHDPKIKERLLKLIFFQHLLSK